MIDISVVIPYYNESDTIQITLDAIDGQTYKPKEVIFINSSSTDLSSEVIDQWIEVRPINDSIRYLNIKTNSKTPSTSKNIGINKSNSEWLAFMDCGLAFNKEWLESLAMQLQESDFKPGIVSGVCQLHGYTDFDMCAVAHTYGVDTNRVCIPGSLVKKSVFGFTGYFLENMRASYDRAWQKKTRELNIERITPENHNVSYIGINFSKSFFSLFKKIVIYSKPAVSVDGYRTPIMYIISVFIAIFILTKYVVVGLALLLFYTLGRGYFLPFYKSCNRRIILNNVRSVFLLPLVGATIDIGRFCGYLLGYKDKLLKIKR